MPLSFLNFPCNSLCRYRLALLLIVFPFTLTAQSLTGLWSGISSNDSTTIRKNQSFEIALTESNGSVWGYSLSEFIVNDTLYYIVKKVKGVITGDSCEVTDEEIITNNFQGKLDKGVKVTSTFRRNRYDSTWHLDGKWKTNSTKKYFALTGKVGLQTNEDLAASKLFAHLEEMKLTETIAFYQERKNEPFFVKIAKPEKIRSEYNDGQVAANDKIYLGVDANPSAKTIETINLASADTLYELPVRERPVMALTNEKEKKIGKSDVSIAPKEGYKNLSEPDKDLFIPDAQAEGPTPNKTATINSSGNKNITNNVTVKPQSVNKSLTTPDKNLVTTTPNKNSTTVSQPVINKPAQNSVAATTVNKQQVTTNKPQQQNQNNPAANNKPLTTAPVSVQTNNAIKTFSSTQPFINKPNPEEIAKKSAVIEGRKSEFRQIVNYQSDSLVLALYDNGEIDGDTVSVFLNGQVIIDKQMLTAVAIKKTIYITPEMDEFRIVMYAENLGKYPPNTGLLVVHDGEDVYNLQFSSDFDKSAGIIFRRKGKD